MNKKAKSNKIQRLLACLLAVCTVGVNTVTVSLATEETGAVPTCGITEHTHGQACYTTASALTCGLEQGSTHAHDTTCYAQQQTLICSQTELEAHQHSDACNTVAKTLTCQLGETAAHSHTAECYPSNLTCTLTETAGHTHGDTCVDENNVNICGEEEVAAHSHGEGCYTVSSEASCGKAEGAGHTHGEGCYSQTTLLSCGKEETQGHSHADACYETKSVQICTLSTEPHAHGESCYTTSTQQTCTLGEHTHTEACYPAVCTCGAADDVHVEGCALYTAPTCTCGAADGVHVEGCALYTAPTCTCGTDTVQHQLGCPLFVSTGILGSTYSGDAVVPTMSAKLYSSVTCADENLICDLMAANAEVSGWTYDTDLYLEVELNNIKTEADTAYQLVIGMQPVLYLNLTSAPSMDNAQVTYTPNGAVSANDTGSYTPEAYSLEELTYHLSKDVNLCSIILPFRYDNVLWNKLQGSTLGDPTQPLLTISLQQNQEGVYEDVEDCSAQLSQATAGAAMPNATSVVMYNAAGQERSMPLSLKSTETAKVALGQMVNKGYADGHFYQAGEMKFLFTPPSATIGEQTYTMLADVVFPVANGTADYQVTTDENGVVTYTFQEIYYSGNKLAEIQNLRFPEGLGDVTTVTKFVGRATILIGETKLVDGTISVNLDNSEDPVFSAATVKGDANIYDLETVQFLGMYGVYNAGGNSNKVTVKLDFDPEDTFDFGVSTVRVMTPGGKNLQIPVRYTAVNLQGDTYAGEFTLTYNGSGSTGGILINRSKLPAAYREDYYYKTLEYDLEQVPGDTYLYNKSATKSRSSGGTVWGYVFSDEGKTYQSFNADLVDSATGASVAGMARTVNLSVTDNTTVSYGLKNMYLSESDESITAGESVIIGGDVFVIEYPYSGTNCLSDIRIGLLLPAGMTVVEQGITATFANRTELEVADIIPPESVDDLWIVQFAQGEKIGYANESMGAISNGSTLKFRIQLNSSTLMPQQTLDLQQCVFVAGYQRSNGASGSYSVNAIRDWYDLTENGSTTDNVGCFSETDEINQKKLTISPTPAVLDIETSLSKVGSSETDEKIIMNTFADEILYHINIRCARGGSAGEFLYIIPIVNTQSEEDEEFVNKQQVDLKMLREATVTHNSGTYMDVLYTTESFATYEEAKASSNWWSAAGKPAGTEWKDVTMLKVVAAQPKTRGANVVIENGTNVTISVPLGFAGDPLTYPSYAGLENSWQSRGYYDYTLGYRMASDNSSPEVSVVIHYQPSEEMVIKLTAVQSSDTENEKLKTASFALPESGTTMQTAQSYTITQVATQDVTLVSSDAKFNTMTSTEASKTFAIKVRASENDSIRSETDLLANGTEIGLGELGKDTAHTFTFEIINGDALSDPTTPRSVTFTLVGDNGILVPVRIEIKQLLALAEAEGSAIVAGKQYLQFNDTTDTVSISQDAAFTAQFIAKGLLPGNYKARTLAFSKAPAVGTTIVMVDWTSMDAPRYYHYKQTVSGTTSIPLTEFRGMGGGADYENPTGGTVVREVLLFIVQFPQNGESVTDNNTISLIRTDSGNQDFADRFTYHTKAKRTFTLGRDKATAALGETVTLTYTSKASAGAESRYTGGRALVIQTAGGGVLPVEARLEVNGTTYLQNSAGQFLVPVSAADSVTTDIRLKAESVEQIQLSAQLWVSANEKADKPLMGQPVAGPVELTLEAAEKPAFKVMSMDKRLLHREDLSSAITVTFDTRHVATDDKLTVELQRKDQAGFVTETTGLNAVNGNTNHTVGVFTIPISEKTLTLRFLSNMPSGTYRLLFTLTASGTEMEVPYGFLLID